MFFAGNHQREAEVYRLIVTVFGNRVEICFWRQSGSIVTAVVNFFQTDFEETFFSPSLSLKTIVRAVHTKKVGWFEKQGSMKNHRDRIAEHSGSAIGSVCWLRC
jgi:hypothetical protein